MKNRPFHQRLGFAVAGIREGWRRERSFRTQVLLGGLAVVALLILRPAPIWWALFVLIIALIWAMELMNSALETLIDHLHPGLHDEIRALKDMAAGAVLVLSLASLVIAAMMLLSLI